MQEPSTSRLSPEQLRAFIESCAPLPQRNFRLFVLLGLGALMGVVLFSGPSMIALLLPWVVVIGFFGWLYYQRRRMTEAQRSVRAVQELTVLRHHDEALHQAWRILPSLRRWADLHVQTVLLASADLMAVNAYENALAAQDYLLEHAPDDHPLARMVRLQRTMALLHDDRLADADDELRRLSRLKLGPLGQAMRRVGELYQQLKTGHHVDAVESLDDDAAFISQLRPLGVDAGYGYAMMATMYHHTGRTDAAQRWWHRATMLVAPQRLADDLPETRPLTALQPATTLAEAMEADRHG